MNLPATTTADAAETGADLGIDEAELMRLAEAADNAAPGETVEAPDLNRKAAPNAQEQDTDTPAEPGDEQQQQQQQQARKPAEKGNEQKPTKQEAKPGEKPESAYSKAQKDAERRDRSWKALDEEKATFRQEKAALQAELEGLRREVQDLRTKAQPPKPAVDEHGFSAEVYDGLAAKYREEGNTRMEQLARQQAEKLRQQTATSAAPAGDSWRTPEFQRQWKAESDAITAQEPALKDPQNPVFKATNLLVNDPKWSRFFLSHPTGLRAAVEVAKLMQRAEAANGLQTQLDTTAAELTKAKAEVERLTKLTQPRGSLPSAPLSGDRKITDMSDDEAEAEVRRLAEAADRGEVG